VADVDIVNEDGAIRAIDLNPGQLGIIVYPYGGYKDRIVMGCKTYYGANVNKQYVALDTGESWVSPDIKVRVLQDEKVVLRNLL